MGKATGFLEFERKSGGETAPKDRIKNYNDFHEHLLKREQQQQAARCMDCGVPFCQSSMMIKGMTSGCPLNNLIPEWNDLIYLEKPERALGRLLKTNSFPEFTSRVCPAPCEAACTCGLNDTPVTIKENEWSIIENGYASGLIQPNPPKVRTGKRIAVVGSGPSGLAAADQLNKRGHSVVVFERNDRVGGLLMYGIPNMKLEKNVIDRKVNMMKAEGIEFVTNADIGNTVKAEKLMKEYDCVILACGASNPRDIKASGREGKGIYFAVDFLKATTKSLLDSGLKDGKYISAKGKNVLVIGGGDTGNDCVGTSVRHGAKSVVQLEMMPKPPTERTDDNRWPEWPKVLKTDYGQQEAIAVFGRDPRIYETTVTEFVLDKDGNVTKAKTAKLEKKTDKTGVAFVPVKGSEKTIDVDLVLIAAGFVGAEAYVTQAFKTELNERTNVKTAENSFHTSVPKVFVTGDMHRGQSLVVWAIREGRSVAREVDETLMGYTNLI